MRFIFLVFIVITYYTITFPQESQNKLQTPVCIEGDCISGKGKMLYPDSTIYEGNFYEKQRWGSGKMIYSDSIIYIGNWCRNFKDGRGILYYPNGDVFIGTFSNDEIIKGILTTKDGKKIHY